MVGSDFNLSQSAQRSCKSRFLLWHKSGCSHWKWCNGVSSALLHAGQVGSIVASYLATTGFNGKCECTSLIRTGCFNDSVDNAVECAFILMVR